MRVRLMCGCASTIFVSLLASAALAQTQSELGDDRSSTVEEIVVTANKREQQLSDVGQSVTAVTGEALRAQGINSAEDLTKVVPGFSFSETQFDAPVYTLRGVGYYESALAAAPTVSVYVDEVPLPYPVMTRGAVLDLERVEVLKGPQGTLFGQNSTGGAINYIANKPTDSFEGGVFASYARFNQVELQGHVSGPLGETVRARVAGRIVQGGAWQESSTRDDQLGDQDIVEGRLLLDFEPSGTLRFSVNLNGFIDKSDTQAAQNVGVFQSVPGALNPGIVNQPLARADNRDADWDPGLELERDNTFAQGSLRADWELTDNLTLTSISAYQRFERGGLLDVDGTPVENLNIALGGEIKSFNQEVRISGDYDRLTFIVGANYAADTVEDVQQIFLGDSPGAAVGPFRFRTFFNTTDQDITTAAVFASGEYELTDRLTLEGGARYTESERAFTGCTRDAGDDALATIFGFIQQAIYRVPVTAAAGQCVTVQPDFRTGANVDELNEDNVSWRIGAKYEPTPSSLIYANVSKGYKAGSFPTLSASSFVQLAPVTQEELIAYEVGFKAPLFDRSARLNGALFYYDYKDKQLTGTYTDPLFGQLNSLVNIPRSTVQGAELELAWTPVEGLSIAASAAYVETEIDRSPDGTDFTNFTQFGAVQSFTGTPFPFSPELQLNATADYQFGINERFNGFVGGSVAYRSETQSSLGRDERLAIDAYTLVDLRAGVSDPDGRWKLSVFGRNVFDEHYWNNFISAQDTNIRYAGRPAEYGVSLSYDF